MPEIELNNTGIDSQESQEPEQRLEVELEKEQKIELEREQLLHRLADSNLSGLREKVAFILNHYPKTRNSDIALSWQYWRVFQPEYIRGGAIDENAMNYLTRTTSIGRARAKIQNEFNLFLADEPVRRRRMILAEEERDKQIADKPSNIPEINFYVDESSKTSRYVIVGGVCSQGGIESFKLLENLTKWKASNNISFEFHFPKLSKHKLQSYQDFFAHAVSQFDTLSFKAVALDSSTTKKNITDIVRELHYHLTHIGISHEVDTKRLTLPRNVTLFKDREDGDGLEMEKLKQDLDASLSQNFEGQVTLDRIFSLDSENNFYIQLADLFIGSIARIINRDSESNQRNQKDEFADFVCSLLRLDLTKKESIEQDSSFVYFIE
jgi:hypothetical protein